EQWCRDFRTSFFMLFDPRKSQFLLFSITRAIPPHGHASSIVPANSRWNARAASTAISRAVREGRRARGAVRHLSRALPLDENLLPRAQKPLASVVAVVHPVAVPPREV